MRFGSGSRDKVKWDRSTLNTCSDRSEEGRCTMPPPPAPLIFFDIFCALLPSPCPSPWPSPCPIAISLLSGDRGRATEPRPLCWSEPLSLC